MMRKFSIFALIVMILISSFPGVYASKYSEADKVSLVDGVSGVEGSYVAANLLMGSNDVVTDMPAILYNLNGKDRTLVPVRVISESIGAKVTWDAIKQTVTIVYKGKTMVLTVDSAKAKVNGVSYNLPDNVPAKLMNFEGVNRTLVPVRFISEQLGLVVNWVGDTRTVILNQKQQAFTNITFSDSGAFQEVFLQTTGNVEVSSFYLNGGQVGESNQLVIDLPNTLMKFSDRTRVDSTGVVLQRITKNDIISIRASQFEKEPLPKTRVVIELGRQRGYEIIKEAKGIRIQFVNTVQDVRLDSIQGAKALVIRTAESPTYNITTKGKQVLIDVLETRLSKDEAGSAVVSVASGGIANYQSAQLTGNALYGKSKVYSRITVNLDSEAIQNRVFIHEEGNEIFCYVSENPIGDFYYGKDADSSAILYIEGQKAMAYQTMYDKDNRILQLRVPEAYAYLNNFELKPNDHMVDTLDVVLVDGFYLVTMRLSEGVTYLDRTKGKETQQLEIRFENPTLKVEVAQNKLTDKLIVIDAGHGGKDPGAISKIDGTKEKDIALSVAIKLKKSLESFGYRVYLTRDYDNYVGLYDRATIANDLKADVFLSLHLNSAPMTSAKGVEMLYVADGRDSKRLASDLLESLVSKSGAKNRGIIERPNLVVIRETLMPAVLAEIGFLSNPEEINQLNDANYIQIIVQGLVEGLLKYLKP